MRHVWPRAERAAHHTARRVERERKRPRLVHLAQRTPRGVDQVCNPDLVLVGNALVLDEVGGSRQFPVKFQFARGQLILRPVEFAEKPHDLFLCRQDMRRRGLRLRGRPSPLRGVLALVVRALVPALAVASAPGVAPTFGIASAAARGLHLPGAILCRGRLSDRGCVGDRGTLEVFVFAPVTLLALPFSPSTAPHCRHLQPPALQPHRRGLRLREGSRLRCSALQRRAAFAENLACPTAREEAADQRLNDDRGPSELQEPPAVLAAAHVRHDHL
mmetsp:Transcript_120174/g.340187  ORF Transcript_120174/g.340187 Transcript_120174/m.340187 type:complete len:274 (+) Transcript_120174:667-1488(+)